VGILLIVLVVFALTGITAAIWGFLRPLPGDPAEAAPDDEPRRPPGKEQR